MTRDALTKTTKTERSGLSAEPRREIELSRRSFVQLRSGGDTADNRQYGLIIAFKIGGTHRIAINGGVLEGRKIDRRNYGLRQDPSIRIGQRDALKAYCRGDPLREDGARLIDRHEPTT